jgi:hypothetical protein
MSTASIHWRFMQSPEERCLAARPCHQSLSTNSSYTIDSGYLNNYRQIASSVKAVGDGQVSRYGRTQLGIMGASKSGQCIRAELMFLPLGSSVLPPSHSFRYESATVLLQSNGDGWGMHRYILFSNSTGSKYFSSDKNGAVPNLSLGYLLLCHGSWNAQVITQMRITIRSPGSRV